MPFDHEKFNNIFSGIQSIVICLAFIVGGYWSLHKFDVLQSEKFRKNVEVIEKESEKPVLHITIDAKQVTLPEDTSLYILAKIGMQNVGSTSSEVDACYFNDPPITISKINFDENKIMQKGWTNQLQFHPFKNLEPQLHRSVIKGSMEYFEFFFLVPEPGLYLLSFDLDSCSKEYLLGFTDNIGTIMHKYLIVQPILSSKKHKK